MTTHPMHLFDPALKGLKGKPKRLFIFLQQRRTMFF